MNLVSLVHPWVNRLGAGLCTSTSSAAAGGHLNRAQMGSTNSAANNHRLLLTVVLLLLFAVSLCNCASFYGLSYIRLPLQETKNSTDLEFRFKTHQLNAFLFLAAGTSDYFLVFLEAGQLAVKINFGSGETYLASDGLHLNDLSWHKVKLKLVKSHLSLTVDDRHNFLQRLKGDSTELQIKYGIFLGGQDNFKSLYLGNIRPLRGCLDKVFFNFKDLLAESVHLQSAISHNVAPDCDEQFAETAASSASSNNQNGSISFIADDSFVLLPSLSSTFAKNHSKLSVHLEVRSLSHNAVLLFSPSVSPYKRRYIALELVNGSVRFALNDGTGGERSVQSPVILKEGQWQVVEATVTSSGQLMLTVNGKQSVNSSSSRSWSFASHQYSSELLLGGLNSRTDWSGLQSVMRSQNVSLKGCLRNVQIYGRGVSLLDALATHQVKSGKCRWHFLCTETSATADSTNKSPCIDTAQCLQNSINQVRCLCPADNCIRGHFKAYKSVMVSSERQTPSSSSSSSSSQCQVTLKRLRVLEGSSAAINYQVFSAGTGDTTALMSSSLPENTPFEVIRQPKFGSLEGPTLKSFVAKSNQPLLMLQTFTWFDVLQGDLLLYRHSGRSDLTEHTSDLIELRMKPSLVTPVGSTGEHQQNQCESTVFTLPLDIVSANDDPSKSSLSVVHMKIAQNSKKLLPYTQMKLNYKEFIKVREGSEETVEFTLGQMLNGGGSYFERASRPNVPIRNFTEAELKNQAIRFVHVDNDANSNSSSNSLIEATLHVHSGKVEVGQFRLLIATFATELLQVANTGLVMAHNTVALLNPANLSFSLGGPANEDSSSQSQLIKYEIVAGPKYGVVQKLRASSNQWANATHFSQRQLLRSKVRYVHLVDRPKADQMTLSVSLAKQQVSQRITFMVRFVDQLKIVSSGPNRHYPNGGTIEKEVLIDSSKLSYRTEPASSSSEIRFTLLSVPQCGGLYLVEEAAAEADQGDHRGLVQQQQQTQVQLHVSSSFSQKDVNEGKLLLIRNNARRKCADISVDLFDFEVAIVGSNTTHVATFSFDIGQTSRKKDELTNSKLNVNEGENATIEANHLYFSAEREEEDIVLKISRPPEHGELKVLSADFSQVNHASPTQIALKYIKQGRLLYVHDNSESPSDTFDFVVASSSNRSLASGTFFIEVTLKNDNSPVRLVDRPFSVIRGGEKPLLGSDLRYADADLNTSASSILYTNTHIPNGQLLFLNGSSAENGFTQADLDRGAVLFRHNGSDIGKAILWITDGQFYHSGVLEIRAAEPYLRLANNTGLVLKYGMNGLITSAHLDVDTNVDTSNKSTVLFRLTSEPKFGQVLVNEKMANQFTLEELEDELVQYESTVFEDEEPASRRDSFSFKVLSTVPVPGGSSSGLVSDTYEFSIRIYPPSYYNLELVHHNNLTVLEEKTALISSKTLLTKHSELGPEQIVYRVVQRPANGHLVNSRYADLADMAKRPDGQSWSWFSFTQEDINQGRVTYLQSVKTELDPYSRYWDHLIFDVGNEVVRSGNQTLYIEVITRLITIVTSNITVSEGQATILSESCISVSHPYYERLVDQFIVIEEPKYGSISYESPSGMPLTAKSFTPEQLKEGKIAYRQDSSEVSNDWFTVVARSNALDRESLPATVHISISSVNDEAPKVVNNSVAWVWQGGTVRLTSAHLAAVDQDNAPGEILYTTYHSSSGYLVDGDSNTTVDSFTQEAINAGRIVFVHVGTASEGGFRFHVTDGANSGVTSTFRVAVRQRRLLLAANEKLIVSPGMVQSITRRHLQVAANDDDNATTTEVQRNYTYRVVKAPSYGRLLLESNGNGNGDRRTVVSHFSQQDIDENQVLYEQNVRITEPVVSDRVIFNIESEGLETLESVHFMVEIAVQSLSRGVLEGGGNVSKLVAIAPLNVVEGGIAAISSEQINLTSLLAETPQSSTSSPKLCLLLLSPPAHGLILRNGVSVVGRECLPLEASRNGSLVYKHDHSNTLEDCVRFRLMLGDEGIQLLNVTLPVVVQPVNDEFPVVINRNPTLKAVFGSRTVVTNQTLRARDDDGPSFDLLYQLRREGGNVTRESCFLLARTDLPVYREEQPVYEFRQSDVDAGRLYFNHRGGAAGKELHLIYWFRVKDDPAVRCDEEEMLPPAAASLTRDFEAIVKGGKSKDHCTPYYPLKVAVAQLSLNLVNHSAVQLPQGAFQVTLGNEHLATVSKNASPNFVRYRVTKGPFHGYLSVDGESLMQHQQRAGGGGGGGNLPLEFSQQNVDSGQVQYHVTNMSSEDYFIVDISQPYEHQEKPIYDVYVKIVTRPLVKAAKPFLVTSPGQQVLLSQDHLDAESLAQHTRSNPVYKILTPPKYGHFKLLPLLHFGESEASSPVDGIREFTHKEIMDNRIAYVAKSKADLNNYPPSDIVYDEIKYELSANGVQKAHGTLFVSVFPNRSYMDHLETLLGNSADGSAGSGSSYFLEKAIKAGLSTQLLLVLATILATLLLVITLVAIIRAIGSCKHPRSTGMPEQSSTKSLSGGSSDDQQQHQHHHNNNNNNLERCGRQYSSTSLRQTDCGGSSRTTSSSSQSALALQAAATSASTGQLNSLLNNNSNHNTQSRMMRYADLPILSSANHLPYSSNIHHHQNHRPLLAMGSLDFISTSGTTMRPPPHGPRSDKSPEDHPISPLPPPSLYFINDSSASPFDDDGGVAHHQAQQLWCSSKMKQFEMQPVGRDHHNQHHQNRSSGEGTSDHQSDHHSHHHHHSPPHHSTMKAAMKGGKPSYDQFVHLDNCLSKSQSLAAGVQEQSAFYTLNGSKRTSKQQTLNSHSQPKSQYWI